MFSLSNRKRKNDNNANNSTAVVDRSLYAPVDYEIGDEKKSAKFIKAEKKRLEKEMSLLKKQLPKENKKSRTESIIPYIDIFEGGVFQHKNNTFTCMFAIDDLNYSFARDEDQMVILSAYCELLNYFPTDMRLQLFLNNSLADMEKLQERMFIDNNVNDGLDEFRTEYNGMITKQVESSHNDIEKDIYLVVAMKSDTATEAIEKFATMEFDLISICKKLGTNCRKIPTEERMEILHNLYRHENVGDFNRAEDFDVEYIKSKRINSKKFIAPVAVQVKPKFITVENRYVKTLYITNESLKNSVNDEFITNFTKLDMELQMSVSIEMVSEVDAAKLLRNQILGMESNILADKKKLVRAVGDASMVSQRKLDELEEARQLRQEIQGGQKMFFVTYTLSVYGKTMEEVNKNVESVQALARRMNVECKLLDFQQLEAYIQTMPYCEFNLHGLDRTLTTETLAIFLPFKAASVRDKNGIYCGINYYTKEIIYADRLKHANANGMIVGVPGSGKSFAGKREAIIRHLTNSDCTTLIIDPEREYGKLIKELGGEVIVISNESNARLNPFDIMEGDTLDNKTDLIISLIEQMKGREGITGQEYGILVRCINIIYQPYLADPTEDNIPVLKDLYDKLREQPEKEAHSLSVILEGYLNGVLSHKTNVNVNNRLIVFDIHALGSHNKTLGLLLTLDACWNRILANRESKKITYLFIDEIYLLFENEFSANYLYVLWKRVRKYNAVCTGITQNVEDMLNSDKARTMLSNSEYLYILRQSYSDVEKLQDILNLSDRETEYLRQASVGQGLMKCGNNIIPFTDDFPQDTKLYKLMTTKPDDLKDEAKAG